MATDLARAYRACARTTRRHARNFYFAFLSLPRAQRRAVYALYAFCREADSVADAGVPPASAKEENGSAILPVGKAPGRSRTGVSDSDAHAAAVHAASEIKRTPSETGGGTSDDLEARRAGLEAMRERLAQAASGTPETARDLALADAIARFGVREEDLRDVIVGVEMDLTLSRIETYKGLRTYCYHVASAVGLATLPILARGVPAKAELREAAVDLGLGMQFVNILRDVDEDLALGRIYLPSEDLAAHGVDEAHLRARKMTPELRSLLKAHGDRARDHLSRGRRLLSYLPRRSRACPWLLSEIYGRILARIVEADYRVFGTRVSLPAVEKLWLLASSPWRRL
jgi:phytoene synthase